jgi:hypothetical protein
MNRAMTTFTKDVALATITALADKYGFSIDEATRFVGIEELAVPKTAKTIKSKSKSKREAEDEHVDVLDKPKRPPTAFFLFCADVRSKTDEKKTQSMLSESWKALSDEEKKPFEDKSKSLKEEYHASKPVTKKETKEKPKKGGRKKKGDQPEAVKATDPDLPAAPEGWSGPFEGTSLKYPQIDGKRFQAIFDSFGEATTFANNNNTIYGIVKTKKGYVVRLGKSVTNNASTKKNGEVCWIKNADEGSLKKSEPEAEPEQEPEAEPEQEPEAEPEQEPEAEAESEDEAELEEWEDEKGNTWYVDANDVLYTPDENPIKAGNRMINNITGAFYAELNEDGINWLN